MRKEAVRNARSTITSRQKWRQFGVEPATANEALSATSTFTNGEIGRKHALLGTKTNASIRRVRDALTK
ncbi:hypothetical protein WN55_04457 [Dufourea novaeangliae]|uniref:Uncharacterized protein n=1 Tax=Dufourea novaeangliae TaxID=178035 RepID=A0A154PNV3_DUFNO|nr:hypothetical protein WN55_04457 [Dufourea novaeangliae]